MLPSPIDLKSRNTTNGWNSLRWLLPLIILLALPLFSAAQSKKELEDRRRKLLREIQVTEKLLNKTNKSKAATLDRYIALQRQIERRERLINTIEAEIRGADESIARTSAVVVSLQSDLSRMQAEYGQMVRHAYRRKVLSNPLLFILSAENLNQAFRRWLFLRKYDRFRKQQSRIIAATRETLLRKMLGLEEVRREKTELLNSLQGQQSTLMGEMTQKEVLLKSLNKDEETLKSDLKTKQQAHEALNQAIEKVILAEVQRQLESSRRPSSSGLEERAGAPNEPATTSSAGSEKAAIATLTQSFRKNQGRLPWPVESGFISRGYGRQKHPTIKSVEITNNGIDIRTEEGESVKAIFEGSVTGIQFIPGHDYTVILQHGEYYSVYTNLSEVFVSKGEEIKARQVLGKVSSNPITGASELHFELWQQKERMNPNTWIKGK